MRQIKYEVWDKRNRRIANSISKICWFLGWEIASVLYEVSEIETVTLYKWDFELREFTWLLDKNWKEIYEGDIMDRPMRDGISHWVVTWDEWCCAYFVTSENSSVHLFDSTWENDFWYNIWNVIWNIYSNPDLLSK